MDMDELEPIKSHDYTLGTDLSKLSVDELRALIETLKGEIVRIENAAAEKESQRNQANEFFKS